MRSRADDRCPHPLAAAAGALRVAVKAIADAPCPPPNLAPEVAASIDCAAMARFKDAVAYVPRPIMAALPAEVDLRRHGLTGPVRDQAQVGACAGFAMAAALDNAVRLRGGGEPVSSLHVFSHYGLDVQRTYFSESL